MISMRCCVAAICAFCACTASSAACMSLAISQAIDAGHEQHGDARSTKVLYDSGGSWLTCQPLDVGQQHAARSPPSSRRTGRSTGAACPASRRTPACRGTPAARCRAGRRSATSAGRPCRTATSAAARRRRCAGPTRTSHSTTPIAARPTSSGGRLRQRCDEDVGDGGGADRDAGGPGGLHEAAVAQQARCALAWRDRLLAGNGHRFEPLRRRGVDHRCPGGGIRAALVPCECLRPVGSPR